MTIAEALKKAIAASSDDVFVRRELGGAGSPAQVTRGLRDLIAAGVLVRLGLGVYAKAKPSVLSGMPIPVRPVEILAPIALRKLGVAVGPSRLTAAYNEGISSQLPAGVVFNTGHRRITRRLGFGGHFVQYESEKAGAA